MENTWSLQGNLSFSFKLLCLCDRCQGQVHHGSVVLHRRWIWLHLSEEEQCKTSFSRFADFGLVFRKRLSWFQQMIAQVWSQKGHEDYKRGQFPSPVVSEPIYCLFQRTERLNLGEINIWLLEGMWTEIAVSISFPLTWNMLLSAIQNTCVICYNDCGIQTPNFASGCDKVTYLLMIYAVQNLLLLIAQRKIFLSNIWEYNL